jgi:hypothetical protein
MRTSQSAASRRAGEEVPICLMVSCGVVFCVKFFGFCSKNSRKLRLIPLNEAIALRPSGLLFCIKKANWNLNITYGLSEVDFSEMENLRQPANFPSKNQFGRAGENRRF